MRLRRLSGSDGRMKGVVMVGDFFATVAITVTTSKIRIKSADEVTVLDHWYFPDFDNCTVAM